MNCSSRDPAAAAFPSGNRLTLLALALLASVFHVCPGAMLCAAEEIGSKAIQHLLLLPQPSSSPVTAAAALRNRLPARRHPLRINPDLLLQSAAWPQPGQHLRLDLLPEQDITVEVQSVTQAEDGRLTVHGRATSDEASSVSLAFHDGQLTGFVTMSGLGHFQILPAAESGFVEVSQLAPHRPGFCATGCLPQFAALPGGVARAAVGRHAGLLPAADTLTEPTVVDVLFLYTPLALTGEGSEAGLRRRVQAGVDETNLRLSNSGANVRVSPVWIGLYDTFETGGMPREFFRLSTGTDGFERVPQLRNDYKADLVCLITELDGDNYLAGAYGVAPTLGDPQYSTIIIRRHALAPGSRVLAHEFGHLFGLEHDREHATLDPEVYRVRKPYIFAHRTQIEGVTYIDLMSYEPGIFVPYFSSPQVSIDGVPLGVPADQPNPSDGARAINETAPYVAGYRTALSRVEFTRNRFVGRREELGVTVQLRRSGDLNTSTRVTVVFDSASPAKAGTDYQRPSSTAVTFGTNQAAAELVIPLIAGSAVTGERALHLSLSSVLGDHGIGSIATTTVAIFAPDTPTSYGEVEFTEGPLSVRESAGEARIRMRYLGDDAAGTVVLPYRTVPGTARMETDFTPVSGTLTNLGGTDGWEVVVPILARPDAGMDRSFSVVVGTRTNAVVILDEQRLGTLKFGVGQPVKADGGFNCFVRGDGRLLVWGNFSEIAGVPRTGLALLRADGTVDESFRPPEILLGHRRMTGIGTTESQTANAAIALVRPLPDGRLLVAGEFSRVNGSTRRTLMRLYPDGSVDDSFRLLDFNGAVKEVLVQRDGRLLVGGAFTRLDGEARGYLVRLHSDGAVDPSFQPKGGPTSEFSVSMLTPTQQSDGRTLMGGLFRKVDGAAITNLARLNVDGTLDTTFRLVRGASGPVTSVRVLADDRILVAGFFDSIGTRNSPRIARLLADGSVDSTFRSPNPDAEIREVFPLPDGRTLISGRFTQVAGAARRSLALLKADGSVDITFHAGTGPSLAPGIAAAFAGQSLAPAPDGTLYVTGEFEHFNGYPTAGLARLNIGEPAPRLGSISRGKEGVLQATVTGLPGGRYPVESSADLQQWEPAGEVHLQGYDPQAEFTAPTVEGARFFRLKPHTP
jgi:uncharacterized delta-60 repeat protein